jgi:large subunit ribosomal protein L24
MGIAKKLAPPPARIELKKEDTVKVIAGRDKGKTGRVLGVNRMIKRHMRPNPQQQSKGGIMERESSIAISNVMIVCPGCNKAVRMKHHLDHVAGGKTRRTRVCRKCGQTLDKK